MSTDAGTSNTEGLAAQLEKAAALLRRNEPAKADALLKKQGLEHATDKLLAPENGAQKNGAKTDVKKLRGRVAAKALAENAKAKKAERTAKPKKAAKSAAKSKPEKRKAVSGQSGPAIKGLKWDDLNKKEKLLLGCFDLEGEREIRTIEQLGADAYKSQTKKIQNSWSRNSLRRLTRSEPAWVEKVEPGKYRQTAYARTALRS